MGAAVAIQDDFISLEEYLAREESSEVRHEYHDGQIYAMAGGSPAHAQIGFNTSVAIGQRLRGKRCRGASSDQRIFIESANRALYPDVVVVCPPEEYSERDPHALTNPKVIVEVISPASAAYDRGAKFDLYALIPEVTDYLLVAQDRIFVQHFARRDEGSWILRRFNRREESIPLPALEIEVPLDEIYDGLDLPPGLVLHGSLEDAEPASSED
jgi:Uma2 family endonuclease